METVEQKREAKPTSKPEELNPLEVNVDDIRQWQAMDPTLAKHVMRLETRSQRETSELASITVMACSTRSGDQRGLLREM